MKCPRGMRTLALLVNIEELACELPAACRGRARHRRRQRCSSVLAFLLFNAGLIALISGLCRIPESRRRSDASPLTRPGARCFVEA